jgi:hypothetical protein
MAEICPVCGEEINSENRKEYKGLPVHNYCLRTHIKQEMRERLKGRSFDRLRTDEKEMWIDKFPEGKVGSTTRTVHVKSFDMPFGDMVLFIFKWVMASIPTAIFLAILFAIIS